MQLKVASLLALLVASATSLQRSISPKAPLTLRRYNRGVSEPSSVLDAKVSLEVIMGRKPGSCTGTYNTMAREHDAVILGEDQEGDVWLFAVHGPFLVKGMIRLALEGYTQTPLAAHHEPSAGYLHPYAYVCAETLKTLPRFDHLQHKVASIIKVGLVENGKAVIEEAVKGHRAALCMSPCVRQAFAQGFVCAVDPANADTQVFTSFTYTNAKTLLPIEIMLEDYARPLCEKTKTDAVYLKRGDYAGIFDLWINDEEVGNLLSDWEQKVCCKEYVGISSSGTVTNHGSGFNMKDGYSRTLETGAPLGIWNMGKDADGLMTLDAVVIGAECFLDLCETSKWLTGGEPIVEMMPTEDWGTGKYNPKTQKTETIPIFPRELEGDFVRDASTGKLYRKQFNPWGKYQWNPRDDLDVAACRFDWVDCEACAKNRRVKGAIFIEGGDGFEFMKALRKVDNRKGAKYKELTMETSIGMTKVNHESVADFGDCLGDLLVPGGTPMTEKKQNVVVKAKKEDAPGVVATLSCSHNVGFTFDVEVSSNQNVASEYRRARVPYGEYAFFAAHRAELSRADLNKLGVANTVKAPVGLSIILPVDAASWKNVPGGIARLKGNTNVPIDDIRSFLETGKFRGEATDPLHALFRNGMVVSNKDRRALVKSYADAFVMARRASKELFPIKPENLSKPPRLHNIAVIVPLDEALERATPRVKAKGGKETAAKKEARKNSEKKLKADRERQDHEERYVGAKFDDDDVPDEGTREVVRIEKDEDGTGEWTAVAVLVENEDNEVPYFVNAALDEMIAEYQSALVPAVSGGSGSRGGPGRGAAKKDSAKRAAPPAKKPPARAAKKPYDPKYSEKRGALG